MSGKRLGAVTSVVVASPAWRRRRAAARRREEKRWRDLAGPVKVWTDEDRKSP